MKKLIFTLLLILCVTSTYSQWVSNYGYSYGDVNITNAKGQAVTTDANGFSYVTGYSFETETQNDIVIIKYSPTGSIVWANSYNGTANSNDEGAGICVDVNGNVYVTGSVQNLNRGYDIVILKYNSAGALVWNKEYYSPGINAEDKAWGIAVDTDNNIFITGYGTTGNGYTRIVTQKYLPNGELLWSAFDENSSGDSRGLAIAVNSTGVYVTGYVPANNSSDVVLLKYGHNGGNPVFRQTSGGSGEDKAWGIVVDADNVYITGYVTVGVNNTDCYTAKYSSGGSLLWSNQFNGTGNEIDKAWGIVVDTDGSVYITGQTAVTSTNTNYITVKYSNTGTEVWANQYNGPINGEDIASSIGLLGTNSVIVTGKSWGTALNYDYATVRYNSSTGNQNQVSRYSYSGNSSDMAEDLAITPTNKIVVTGFSELLIESSSSQSYISTLSLDWGSEMSSNPLIPKSFSLYQNYPNPFNPSTSIKFDLTDASLVKLAIYDMLGREVDVLINQQLGAGTHNISFNAGNLASGVYFYKIETGSFSDIKKMTLVK